MILRRNIHGSEKGKSWKAEKNFTIRIKLQLQNQKAKFLTSLIKSKSSIFVVDTCNIVLILFSILTIQVSFFFSPPAHIDLGGSLPNFFDINFWHSLLGNISISIFDGASGYLWPKVNKN